MALVVTTATGVKVNYQQFAQHIAIYQMVMRKTMAEIVKDQSRLFAKDMCDYTPPFSGSKPQTTKGGDGGFGTKARDKGRAAVSRDVRKIFAPLAQAPAAGVASGGNVGVLNAWINEKLKLQGPHYPDYIFRMAQSGRIIGQGEFDYFKLVEAQYGTPKTKFMLGTTEGSVQSIHERVRGKPSYKVKESDRLAMTYVDNWKVVERYIKKVQQRVGRLKSGWYYAGLNLGRMPLSAWIANQGRGTSIFKPRLTGPDPIITLGSSIGRNYSQGYHFMRMAMNHRAYSMRIAMLHHLKATHNHGRLMQVVNRLQGGYTITHTP